MSVTIRQVFVVMLSGILLFLGISSIILTVPELENQPISHFFEPSTFHNFIFHLLIAGLILTCMGSVLLSKSKLFRKFLYKIVNKKFYQFI